jgi:putative autotransporter adhesin-like protein
MTVAPRPLQGHRAPHRLQLALSAALVLALIAIAVVLRVRYDVFGSSSSSSGVQGSGVAATQTRELAQFSGVELAGSNNVVIHVGGKQSVVVRADDNLLRQVTTQVHAGNLVIGNTSGGFTTKSPMSVDVRVPSLEALTLTGSGVISTTGIKTASLTVTLAGSGVLRASGSATRLDVSLGGSGDAQLGQLAARDVHALVSGSGRILVTATRSLDASVPGNGAIVYSGNPAQVTTSITGNGTVTRG